MGLSITRGFFIVFPRHQHFVLSVGGLVLTVAVELLMVSPFPFPVGLMLVLRVDGVEGG